MLTSLALVFLLGLAAAALCSRIGLPRIIGMPVSYTHLDVYKRQRHGCAHRPRLPER